MARSRLWRPFLGVLALSTPLPCRAEANGAADRPNVIFVLADDLGWGDVGAYGQRSILTPHLDRMASEGMRFTQFYAGSTVCAPSRCVLMTGRHTGHCTVRGNSKNDLRPEDVTVAELFQQAGYATALVGKWGLGNEPESTGHPNRQGFDFFYGYLNQVHAHNHFPEYLWRNAVRESLPNDVVRVGDAGGGYATKAVAYADDLLAREALAFVDKNKDRPFFLYWASVVPHANNERTKALGDGQDVPDYGPYADESWPNPNKGLAAMVTRLDADVGRMLAKLKEAEIDRRTLVIFSSDNGPHKEGGQDMALFDSNGPFRGIKRDLTDGGIRVPLIAWWPGRVPPKQDQAQVGDFADFLPTVAELIGVPAPAGVDGVSLVPTLLDRPGQRQREYLYWEFHEGGSSQAVLLDGRWKGLRLARRSAPLQLYELRSDVSEEHDVAAQNPQVVARIEAILARARTEHPDWPLRDVAQPAVSPR
jgi:arylsulfatase A-like enzyme